MTDLRRNYRGSALARRISAGAQDASCCTPSRASATPSSSRAMCRCWRAGGATVVLEVQPELKHAVRGHRRASPLCSRAASRCPPTTCIARSAACRSRSRPTPPAFRPTFPICSADEARIATWRPRIEALPGKRVALAWAGHATPRQRPQPLDRAVAARAAVGDRRACRSSACSAICATATRISRARIRSVTHVGDALADMADTAAVLDAGRSR